MLPKAKPLVGEERLKAMETFLLALRDHGLVSKALDLAAITLDQLEVFREDPQFRALERQCQIFQDDKLREQINAYIAAGDKQIIISAMRKLEEYTPTKQTNINVTGSITHKAVAALPEAELDRLIAEGHKLIELKEGEYEVEEAE